MKITHNCKILMIVLVLTVCTMLAACASQFTCDLCGQNSNGENTI